MARDKDRWRENIRKGKQRADQQRQQREESERDALLRAVMAPLPARVEALLNEWREYVKPE